MWLANNLLFPWNFADPFASLIHLVILIYCKMCDRLYDNQDTDLAPLNNFVLQDRWTRYNVDYKVNEF